MPKWRSYTEQERADAVGRALAIGAKRAALELGIPRRTISSWLHRPTSAIQGAIVASGEAITANLKTAAAEGSAELLAIIRDPKTPARVRVDAIALALQQWTLDSGRATSRVESTLMTGPQLTDAEERQLRDFLDGIDNATDAELIEATPSLQRAWAGQDGRS